MGEFEQWFKSLNENGRVTYFLGQEGKVAKEAWDFQQSKIEQLENKLKAVEEIMNDYYTGSFEDAPELAGWISTALRGDYENQD